MTGDYRQAEGGSIRAALRSYSDHYAFGLEMPGMVWKGGNGYRYGFNGQEKSPEIDDGHTTATYWEYDARTAMRWNTDPVVMPALSPYATFEGNPIRHSDPDGDCPTCPGGDDTYSKGSIVANKDGSWEYLGNHKWKTLSLNMGNSTAGFQSYYNQAGGASAVDAVGDRIYQGKLAVHTNNFAKGVYGQNQDGSVAVPQAIQDRLRNEANAEAFDSFKAIYAMEKSGQDPSSFNYFANPLARAMYAGARANAVTGQGEGSNMIKGVALDVALQYVGRVAVLKPAITSSMDAIRRNIKIGGGNLNVGSNFQLSIKSEVFAPGMTGYRYLGMKVGKFQAAVDYHDWTLRSTHHMATYGSINRRFWHYHWGRNKTGAHHMQFGTGEKILSDSQLRNGIFGPY